MEIETNYLTQENISKYIDYLVDIVFMTNKKINLDDIDKDYESLHFLSDLEKKSYIEPIRAKLELTRALDPLLKSFMELRDKDSAKAYEMMELSGLVNFDQVFTEQKSLSDLLEIIYKATPDPRFADNDFAYDIYQSINYEFQPQNKLHEIISEYMDKYQKDQLHNNFDGKFIPVAEQEQIILWTLSQYFKILPNIQMEVNATDIFDIHNIRPNDIISYLKYKYDLDVMYINFSYEEKTLEDFNDFGGSLKSIVTIPNEKLIEAIKSVELKNIDIYLHPKEQKQINIEGSKISYNGMTLVIGNIDIKISGKTQKDILSLMFRSEDTLEQWFYDHMQDLDTELKEQEEIGLASAMRRLNEKIYKNQNIQDLFLVSIRLCELTQNTTSILKTV